MKYIGTLLFLLVILGSPARAQQDVLVRGFVYDSSRMVTIPQVKVTSTGGAIAYTDSVGYYNILVSPGDSISFSFGGSQPPSSRLRISVTSRDLMYPCASPFKAGTRH